MHVDVIESLRCPHPHADGWLVASADRVVQRRIVRGTVGCPICGAEWPITDGAMYCSGSAPVSAALDERVITAPLRAEALRTAALLDVRDARGVVLLAGEVARVADALAELTGVLLLVVNPPAEVAHAHSRLFVEQGLPLGVGTMRGARLDGEHAQGAWMPSALRAVAKGGRLIAPVRSAVPPELRELARDEAEWVAEVQVAASGLVPLRRG